MIACCLGACQLAAVDALAELGGWQHGFYAQCWWLHMHVAIRIVILQQQAAETISHSVM
jgi:hypothetical protein